MNIKSYHISPASNGNWSVRKGGSLRASRNFGTKVEAINFGRKLSVSHRGELVIHRKDGSIISYNSYESKTH